MRRLEELANRGLTVHLADTFSRDVDNLVTQQLVKFRSLLDEITQKFTDVEQSFLEKFVSYSLKLFTFVSSLLTSAHISVVLGNLMILLEGVVPSISSYLVERFAGAPENCHEGQCCKFVGQSGFSDNVVAQSIMASFTALFGKLSPEETKQFMSDSKVLAGISSTVRSVKTLAESVVSILKRIFDYALEWYSSYMGQYPRSMLPEHLLSVYDQYFEIVTKHRHNEPITSYALEIQQLHKDISDIVFYYNKQLKPPPFAMYFSMMLKQLEAYIDEIPSHFLNPNSTSRRKPIWVFVHGPAQIGKTSFVTPILMHALLKKLQLATSYDDNTRLVYSKPYTSDYWEGYVGQPVMRLTDLFQNLTEEAMSRVMTELTLMCDDVPMPLDMATCTSKGNNYFRSTIIMSDSQQDIDGLQPLNNICLSRGNHVRMRRTVVIGMDVSEKWKNHVKEHGFKFDMDDCSYHDACPDDLYEFKIDICGRSINSLEEMVTKVVEHCAAVYMRNASHTDRTKAVLEALYRGQSGRGFPACYLDAGAVEQTLEDSSDFEECPDLEEFIQQNQYQGRSLLKKFCDSVKRKVNRSTICKFLAIGAGVLSLVALGFALVKTVPFDTKGQSIDYNPRSAAPVRTRQPRGKTNRSINSSRSKWNFGGSYPRGNWRGHGLGLQTNVEEMMRKALRNAVRVCFTHSNCDNFTSGLFITGNILILPRHYWMEYSALTPKVDMRFQVGTDMSTGSYQSVGYGSFEVMPYEELESYLCDVVVVRIKGGALHVDISGYFQSCEDVAVEPTVSLLGYRSMCHECDDECVTLGVKNAELVQVMACKYISVHDGRKPMVYTTDVGKFSLPSTYIYAGANTQAGDCGMMLVQIAPEFRILGMHVAGSKMNTGMAIPLFKEDIDDIIAYFDPIKMQAQNLLIVEDGKSFGKAVERVGLEVVGLPSFDGKPFVHNIPHKSRIVPGPFYSEANRDFGPDPQKPVHLGVFHNGGNTISPLLCGLVKMATVTHFIDDTAFRVCAEHVADTVVSWPSVSMRRKKLVWSDLEALNGLYATKMLDERTSPGFPYIVFVKEPGKLDLVEVVETDIGKELKMKRELEERVREREKLAAEGIIYETYFCDTLKDETREVAKVDAGKTRLFQVGPVDLTIVMRKFFGSFISHCQSTYLMGEIGIGINPESSEWGLLLTRISGQGRTLLMCGDYTNYDATISHQVVEMLKIVTDRFYVDIDNVRARRIRHVLLETIFTTYHIVNSVVYYRHQGNPSGNCLTTIVNCLVNMFLFRYAYFVLVTNDLTQYLSLIDASFYGDDNLVGVHSSIGKKFNMLTFARVVEALGMKYTAAKKGDILLPFVDFEDVTYLKRAFSIRSLNGKPFVYGPVGGEVWKSIPRWQRGSVYRKEDLMSRLNRTLLFAFLVSDETFVHVRTKFVIWILARPELGLRIVELFSRTKCVEILERGEPIGEWLENLDLEDSRPLRLVSQPSQDVEVYKIAGTHRVLDSTWVDTTCSNNIDKMAFECIVEKISLDDIVCCGQSLRTITEDVKEDEQIVTFVEDNSYEMVGDTVASKRKQYTPVSLDTFLCRPIMVHEVTWASTDAIGTQLITLDLPNDLLNNVRFKNAVGTKLANVPYWRPTYEVEMRVTTTPMHYGALVMGWFPLPDYMESNRFVYKNCTQGEFAILYADSAVPLKAVLPFKHFKERTIIGTTERHWIVKVWVMAPLSIANASTVPSVTVNMYLRLAEPNLEAYGDSDYTGQSLKKEVDSGSVEAKQSGNKLSTYVSALGDLVAATRVVPVVGAFSLPVSFGVKAIGRVLAYFGYSNCNHSEAVNHVRVLHPRLCYVEDKPSAVNIGCKPDMSLALELGSVYGNIEDMSFVGYCSHPQLLYQKKIATTTTLGTVLWSTFLTPDQMFYSQDSLSSSPAYYLHVGALARYFDLWRGSFKFHFQFVCSQFHSTRVALYHIPYVSTQMNHAPPGQKQMVPEVSMDYSSRYAKNVYKVVGPTEFSVVVPFINRAEWAEATEGTDELFFPLNRTSGALILQLISNLVAPSTSAADVVLNVWVSVGPDFQFATPNFDEIGTRGVFHSQSGKTLCADAASIASRECETFTGDIYGERISRYTLNSDCVSFKQLASMMTPGVGGDAFLGNSITLTPCGELTETPNKTMMEEMMVFFRFRRGGLRLVPLVDPGARLTVGTTVGKFDAEIGAVNKRVVDLRSVGLVSYTRGAHVTQDSKYGPQDYIVPWIGRYKCVPNFSSNIHTLDGKAYETTFYPSTGTMCAYWGGADDLTFGHKVPLLPITIYAPLSETQVLAEYLDRFYDTHISYTTVYPSGSLSLTDYRKWPADGLPKTFRFNSSEGITTFVKTGTGTPVTTIIDAGMSFNVTNTTFATPTLVSFADSTAVTVCILYYVAANTNAYAPFVIRGKDSAGSNMSYWAGTYATVASCALRRYTTSFTTLYVSPTVGAAPRMSLTFLSFALNTGTTGTITVSTITPEGLVRSSVAMSSDDIAALKSGYSSIEIFSNLVAVSHGVCDMHVWKRMLTNSEMDNLAGFYKRMYPTIAFR
ncbi:MAG: polyprotein [Macrobrachium rosenbergii virus 14]|nr:MAG: polyprotein [Macrobrachium rosenbergii virus 14]